MPVGGGRAWPGFEIDHSERRLVCGDLAGGPPPTGTHPRNNNQHSQRHEAATSFPATASSHSISATQQSGTASDQAVMSTWSSTAARPASRRATGTRKGEQDT